MKKAHLEKLSICALGTALSIIWGVSMLFLAYLSLWFDIGTPIVNLLGSIYMGFKATYLGGIIGLLWGLLDGFIGGALIAALYNFCLKHCACPFCK